MMNARGEDGALQHWAQDVGKQQVGHSFQLIAGSGMTRELQAHLAQMLHRAPHLGAGGAQLFGNAGAADDDRRVVAQQAHNAAQARVGRTVGRDVGAGWRGSGDRTIMRDGRRNEHPVRAFIRRFTRCSGSWRSCVTRSQITAFEDTWEWNLDAERAYQEVVERGGWVGNLFVTWLYSMCHVCSVQAWRARSIDRETFRDKVPVPCGRNLGEGLSASSDRIRRSTQWPDDSDNRDRRRRWWRDEGHTANAPCPLESWLEEV